MTVQKGTPYLYIKNRVSIILTITLLCLPLQHKPQRKKEPYAKQNNQGEPQRNRRQNEQKI